MSRSPKRRTLSNDVLLQNLLEESNPEHPLTNQIVLSVTTIAFALFVIAEIVGALAGNSLSLLGDAAAMSVDVFTYFTNMYAERIKAAGGEISENTRLVLEVFIPLFSVTALLGVTGWITSDAIQVIKDKGGDDDTNILFLYGFAVANFLVDVVSFGLFYVRRNDVFTSREVRQTFLDEEDGSGFKVKVEGDPVLHNSLNLNMMSAFTHVGGDTLRTLSVFVAAVIATTTNVPGSLCDAWAAVVVTITIVIAVIPLSIEIYKAALRHYERSEDSKALLNHYPGIRSADD